MSDLTKHIGEKIRYYRKERKLSQEELAFKAAVHNTYIGQLERGEKNVTVEILAKICAAMDLSLADFFQSRNTTRQTLSIELEQIITLLEHRSKKDQQKILAIIETMLQWKDN